MASSEVDPHIRPPPRHEFIVPTGDCEYYDPFIAAADVLGDDAAVERVDYAVGVDVTGLDYDDQTRLKIRLEAGSGRASTPTTDHAPDEWRGRLTEVLYGGCGARMLVSYDHPNGHNTSMAKPVPNYGTGGYSLAGLPGIIEFYDVDPLTLGDLDEGLPVPVRDPFDSGNYSIDYTRLRDHLLDAAWWGHRPDAFVCHRPWRPDLVSETGTIDTVYDHRGSEEWVSLNPKYRGTFQRHENAP